MPLKFTHITLLSERYKVYLKTISTNKSKARSCKMVSKTIKTMSWFSKTEDYSTKNEGFYGEPEITYGSKKDDSGSGSSSTSGAWDDFQHERERIISSCNDHTR